MYETEKNTAILAMILLNIFLVPNARGQEKNAESGFGYIILEGNSLLRLQLLWVLNDKTSISCTGS